MNVNESHLYGYTIHSEEHEYEVTAVIVYLPTNAIHIIGAFHDEIHAQPWIKNTIALMCEHNSLEVELPDQVKLDMEQ